ncbi:MAG: methylated-DNA--[protein]-cysteine S-methyltransferase [Desulfobacterales bacterium]|nr:methylated-DNA--[protein]-cysteine S-methyltransferase [Desulfobacterales bacterium]
MAPKTVITGCRTTKIYCRPDCPPGRRMKSENKVYFSSRNEARVKGYRACKVCKPDELFRPRETLFFTRYNGPLGMYILASSEKGVVCIKTEKRAPKFLARWEREGIELKGDDKKNLKLINQLDAYFEKKRRRFDLPLDLRGTPFQLQVWEFLLSIPWGETRTYGQTAKTLGRPKAARAVGRAVGTNPVSIVVPCHRIIGSDGSLTGYGGGLDRKTALLELEGLEVS